MLKKINLAYAIILLTLLSCDTNEIKPLYDFNNFHNELVLASAKIESLKQKASASRINLDERQFYEEEAAAIISPLVGESTMLIESYGIIINEELGVISDQDIIVSALSIYRAEIMLANGYTLAQISEILNQDYIGTDGEILDCIGEVLVIGAVIGGLNNGAKRLSKELAIKTIKKVAARFLGPIGIMVAIYEFSDCMGWL